MFFSLHKVRKRRGYILYSPKATTPTITWEKTDKAAILKQEAAEFLKAGRIKRKKRDSEKIIEDTEE